MYKVTLLALFLALCCSAGGQLFNDLIQPARRGGNRKGPVFAKTVNFDNVDLKSRLNFNKPPPSSGFGPSTPAYLPPEKKNNNEYLPPPTYLPPSSTPAPTYLPPVTTTRRITTTKYTTTTFRTFPTVITRNYTYSTTSYRPYVTRNYTIPVTLPPITTPRPRPTGYFYNRNAGPAFEDGQK